MTVDKFFQLHQQTSPLLICNVWDAASAKVAQSLNFDAIATSSAAVANMLGYQDGEALSFEQLCFVVECIAKSTSLPLSVDIEAGFGDDPMQIAANIQRLVQLGVVGVNIEDSKVNEDRSLVDAERFTERLSAVTAQLHKTQTKVFINVRTDTFLLGVDQALEETISRAERYKASGANGLFVPCITELVDMQAVVDCTDLPVNVMCMPNLPEFAQLSKVGVKRISMGNFVFDAMQNELAKHLSVIQQNQSFSAIF